MTTARDLRPGELVRVTEDESPWHGMTGRVEIIADGWGAHVRLTSTGELRAFPTAGLRAERVQQPRASVAREGGRG